MSEVIQVRSFRTEDASRQTLALIRGLLEGAFEEGFSDDDWEHTVGGHHVTVTEAGALVTHAAVVHRTLEVGHTPFATGYVEGVATRRTSRRRGYGTLAMTEVGSLIRDSFDMGALSTGGHRFYERLGWERWQGPSFARGADGRVRMDEEEQGLMVLRFGNSAAVDLQSPISCEARKGDDW